MLMLLLAGALAAECPWPEDRMTELDVVPTSMIELTIEGRALPVATTDNRIAAEITLRKCGMPISAEKLARWRQSRRLVNISAAIAVVAWPAAVVTAVAAANAGAQKRAVVANIRARQ